MVSRDRTHELHALTLLWHAAASQMELGAFRAWALALLAPLIHFDGAIWGLDAATDDSGVAAPGSPPAPGSVHLNRIPVAAMEGYALWRHRREALEGGPGRVVQVSIGDPRWSAARHADLREHAERFRLIHTLGLRAPDATASGPQFLALVRADARFGTREARELGLVAPHLMQAFATNRRLAVAQAQAGRRTQASAALVDASGGVHDADAAFTSLMQQEWPGWSGLALPAALMRLAARKVGQPWNYVGDHLSAEVTPVRDLFLMTVRPRSAQDVLTLREREIAQHYAEGQSYRQIAGMLSLSPPTVRSHLRNVFAKLRITNKAHLAGLLQ